MAVIARCGGDRRGFGVLEHPERGIPIEDREPPGDASGDRVRPDARDRQRAIAPAPARCRCSAGGRGGRSRACARSRPDAGAARPAAGGSRCASTTAAAAAARGGGCWCTDPRASGRGCRARTRAATRSRAGPAEQAQHALDVGSRADRQHGRELVVRAVGETSAREPVDGDLPPSDRAPEDRLRDLDGVHAAGREDLGDRREQAERDPHPAGRRRDRVAQRPGDRAHPIRAETEERGNQREQHPRRPRRSIPTMIATTIAISQRRSSCRSAGGMR